MKSFRDALVVMLSISAIGGLLAILTGKLDTNVIAGVLLFCIGAYGLVKWFWNRSQRERKIDFGPSPLDFRKAKDQYAAHDSSAVNLKEMIAKRQKEWEAKGGKDKYSTTRILRKR